MTRFATLLAALLLVPPLAVAGGAAKPADKPAAKTDDEDPLKKADGKWATTALTFDGDEVPEDVAGKLSFTFKDGKVTMRGGLAKLGDKYAATARSDTYKVELGADGKKKTIDLVEDKAGGRKIPGLYKVEKGKVTVCLNFKNTDRPETFDSKADSGIGVYVIEKAK